MNRTLKICLSGSLIGFVTIGHSLTYYHLTDLGSLGGDYSWGRGLNNKGQVVGWSPLSGEENNRAFLYTNGQMINIGSFPGFESRAYGINDLGQVVGESGGKGFIYKDGVFSDLPLIGGGLAGPAADINNAGQIVGNHKFDTHPGPTAYRYQSGSIEDLGTLWWNWSSAAAINNSGVVVGTSEMDNREVAFKYVDGSMQSLGLPQNGSRSGATDINESGTTVGWGNNIIDDKSYALEFSGAVSAICEGSASAINSAGHVVGQSKTSSGQSMAFLYDGVHVVDLNTRLTSSGQGYWLFDAEDINDSGQILATAWGPVGYFHAVILSPVPEPTCLVTLALGTILIRRGRLGATGRSRIIEPPSKQGSR